jgi:hypothetical protein
MTAAFNFDKGGLALRLPAVFFRLLVMVLPGVLLLGACLRSSGDESFMLLLGAAFHWLVCTLTWLSSRGRYQPIGPSIITLYLIGFCWLWWGKQTPDWYADLSKAILLVAPLLVFGIQMLHDSGALDVRRAQTLADRLSARKDWPADLNACRTLPEVKALRAALAIDASPALVLLRHARQEVRVAALAALEFRKEWKPGQAELVLEVALRTENPTLRSAAVTALANIDDLSLVERLAEFLHDSSVEVRRAAVEAVLWDTERRWGSIRYVVRRTLADPLFQHDGPLWHDGQQLTSEAIDDLTAWATEKGVLASRAAQTLGAYFNRALTESTDGALSRHLKQQLAATSTAAVLRIELGRVLHHHQELDTQMIQDLLHSSNPTPLRLTAVESALTETPEGPLHGAAVAALRDLARMPNREIALATADLIQRRLGIDMGLGLGEPLPPIHSRQAVDVTRRVMTWSAESDDEEMEDSRLPPRRW